MTDYDEEALTAHGFVALIETAEAAGLERFYVTIPRRCTGYRTMSVLPGLRGEVCCENSDGHTVVLVRCDDARRWLKKHSKEVEP